MKVPDMLHMGADDVGVTVQCIFVGGDAQCTLVRPSIHQFVRRGWAGLGRARHGMLQATHARRGEERSLCASEAGRLLHRSVA